MKLSVFDPFQLGTLDLFSFVGSKIWYAVSVLGEGASLTHRAKFESGPARILQRGTVADAMYEFLFGNRMANS